MNVLLDANILVRIADLSAPLRPTAMAAVSSLKAQGHTLCIVPQSLYEFWVSLRDRWIKTAWGYPSRNASGRSRL